MNLKKLERLQQAIEVDQHLLPHFAFVDADNMHKSFSSWLDNFNVPSDQRKHFSFPKLFTAHRFDRVYFYSAVEDMNDLPDWLEEIRSQDGFVLKLGTLTKKGKQFKQEGVDVKLAIDATRFAYTSTMRSCTLFGADGDFIPLVEAVSDAGCKVNIVSFNDPKQGRVAPLLQAEADSYIRIDGPWLYFANTFPGSVNQRMERYHDFRRCPEKTFELLHGQKIEIAKLGGEYVAQIGPNSPSSMYGASNIEQLITWAKMHYAPR